MLNVYKISVLIACIMTIPFWSECQISENVPSRSSGIKTYQKGTQTLDLGVGFINANSTAVNIIGVGQAFTAQPSPSLNIQYEYALHDVIGVGVYMDYYRVNADVDIPPLQSILDDPICAAACALGISTADCNCDGVEYEDRVNVYTIAGRLAYHKRILNDLDTYSTIIAGYSFNRRQSVDEILVQQVLREADISDNLPTFIYKASVGARYYLNNNWGIYGEFGWSNTHLVRLGCTYRIF